MIEVRCYPSGDWAEAETPEAAILAARTLLLDATETYPRGKDSCVKFFNEDGVLIAERGHV